MLIYFDNQRLSTNGVTNFNSPSCMPELVSHCLYRFSASDSFEMPSSRIASVFDLAPASEPMQDMTLEEHQTLVKVPVSY